MNLEKKDNFDADRLNNWLIDIERQLLDGLGIDDTLNRIVDSLWFQLTTPMIDIREKIFSESKLGRDISSLCIQYCEYWEKICDQDKSMEKWPLLQIWFELSKAIICFRLKNEDDFFEYLETAREYAFQMTRWDDKYSEIVKRLDSIISNIFDHVQEYELLSDPLKKEVY